MGGLPVIGHCVAYDRNETEMIRIDGGLGMPIILLFRFVVTEKIKNKQKYWGSRWYFFWRISSIVLQLQVKTAIIIVLPTLAQGPSRT